MIEHRIHALAENVNELGEIYAKHEHEIVEQIATRDQSIEEKESELRESQARCNMLEIGARNHEKENTRTMFAGLIVGAVLGAVFATIF